GSEPKRSELLAVPFEIAGHHNPKRLAGGGERRLSPAHEREDRQRTAVAQATAIDHPSPVATCFRDVIAPVSLRRTEDLLGQRDLLPGLREARRCMTCGQRAWGLVGL